MSIPHPERHRYVRLVCPLCREESPICDQQADIHRVALSKWYSEHFDDRHKPYPIIESVDPEAGP
jgi:hypothetical protein